jgi:Fe-S-cluster containining protein
VRSDPPSLQTSEPLGQGPGCVELDCQTCGACCCNSDENRAEKYVDYVEVPKRTRLAQQRALVRKLTVVNQQGERHMKLVGKDQRCIALEGELGVNVSCGIYELRPPACRKVEPGSDECLRDRAERGIDSLPGGK